MNIEQFREKVGGKLIVSCQALPEEPLHSSFIMGRMALAAAWGGAAGIRANTVEDILEIRKNVDLPIIGIIKKVYEDHPDVYITPTMAEIDALAAAGGGLSHWMPPSGPGLWAKAWTSFLPRPERSIRTSCLWRTAPVSRRVSTLPKSDLT